MIFWLQLVVLTLLAKFIFIFEKFTIRLQFYAPKFKIIIKSPLQNQMGGTFSNDNTLKSISNNDIIT